MQPQLAQESSAAYSSADDAGFNDCRIPRPASYQIAGLILQSGFSPFTQA